MKKRVVITVAGLTLLLAGCGTASHHATTTDNQTTSNQAKLTVSDLNDQKMLTAAIIDYAGHAGKDGLWKGSTQDWAGILDADKDQWTVVKNGDQWVVYPTHNIPQKPGDHPSGDEFKDDGDKITIWESCKKYSVSKKDLVAFINGQAKLPNGKSTTNTTGKVRHMAGVMKVVKHNPQDDAQPAASSSDQADSSSVDTKNLTKEQLIDWVKRVWQHQNPDQNVNDMEFSYAGMEDGYATVIVRFKPPLQAGGYKYHVDGNGNLQEWNQGIDFWTTVAMTFNDDGSDTGN